MNLMLELLFTLTMAGSVASAAILLLRLAPAERFPAIWRYRLGKMAAAFFLLPFALALPSLSGGFLGSKGSDLQNGDAGARILNASPLSELLSLATKPVLALPRNAVIILLLLWAAGVLIFSAWQLYCYIRFTSMLKRSQEAVAAHSEAFVQLTLIKADLGIKGKVGLASSPLLQSPMLVGFFKPIIYLPAPSNDGLDWDMVFRHELIHLKHKDLWVKAISLGISALHWFNPLAHLLRQDLYLWSELSCDEVVVKEMPRPERLRYGQTLLNVVAGNRLLASRLPSQFGSSLSGDGKKLKRRLNAMLNVKQLSKKTLFLLLSTFIIIAAVSTVAAIWATSVTPTVADANDAAQLIGLGEKDEPESEVVTDFDSNSGQAPDSDPDSNSIFPGQYRPTPEDESKRNEEVQNSVGTVSVPKDSKDEIAAAEVAELVAEADNEAIIAVPQEALAEPWPQPAKSANNGEVPMEDLPKTMQPASDEVSPISEAPAPELTGA
ncbi:M56 family metallopeptidase [Paenibacillus sp. CAU 1782]